MRRLLLFAAVLLAVLWLLLEAGALPKPIAAAAAPIVGLACTLAVPGFFLIAYAAPGLFRELADDVSHFWRRLRTRRHDVEELERKIAHLDRAYHMQQLGLIYAAQGRPAKARQWFERALAKDPQSLEARYQLGLCHFTQKDYPAAVELLEAVYAQKPDHDYGMTYLRLAEAQQYCGNLDRAAEVFSTMLQFYPGHPEGEYHYALLLANQNSLAKAKELMRDVTFTVRHSPGFHRRRNRHWALKAQWWLLRHRAV
jgi:tetratricopeptide (TPR) repeat protein